MTVQQRQSDDWPESCVESISDDGTTRLDIYLRSPSPTGGGQREALAAVVRLEAEGVVDESGVHVWGNRICPERPYAETSTGAEFLDVVDQIAQWSSRGGPDAISMFEEKTVNSSMAGQTFDVIVPPHVCLVLTVDSTLTAVAPARVDDECVSATEFLSRASEALVDERAAPEV